MADLPRRMRLPVIAIASLVAVIGGVAAARASNHEPRVLASFAFELVVAGAGAALALHALFGGRRGAALALAVTAAIWAASALLGGFSWHATVLTAAGQVPSPGTVVGHVAGDPWFLSRLGLGAAVALMGLVIGMRGQATRWRRLGTGALMAGVPLAAAAIAITPWGSAIFAPATSPAGLARLAAVVVGGIALAVLFSVGVQGVIRAFEDEAEPARPPIARSNSVPAP